MAEQQNNRENVIFLIGPVGVGKSLVSSELGRRNNLPVITTDIMRHCPRKIEDINARLNRTKKLIEEKEQVLSLTKDEKERENIKAEISKLKNDIWGCNREIEMRTLLPNLPNYEDLGFNGEASNFLRDKFGEVAWHFYQKQFENQLLQALTEQLNFPCIVDMGGGMAVSIDEEYAKFDKKFREINEQLYLKNFKLDKIGFNVIEKTLQPFNNVIELKLPKGYEQDNKKARENGMLNELFVKSGQYHKLAKTTEVVSGIIESDKVNWKNLSLLCEEIESLTGINKAEL